MLKMKQPVAKWASKTCQYAVKKGYLDLWHDCGMTATAEHLGQMYCSVHHAMLVTAVR
jgi:hypothetical protein